MKKVMTSVLVLVCMMLVFSSAVSAERPIRILFIEALSGPPKSIGERHVLGCKFAVEEINAQGGLLGRKLEVIAEDNQFKPDVAIAKAQKYLMKGNVDILMALVMQTGAAIGAQIGATSTRFFAGPRIRLFFSALPFVGAALVILRLLGVVDGH